MLHTLHMTSLKLVLTWHGQERMHDCFVVVAFAVIILHSCLSVVPSFTFAQLLPAGPDWSWHSAFASTQGANTCFTSFLVALITNFNWLPHELMQCISALPAWHFPPSDSHY
jgi:hypothetical protein